MRILQYVVFVLYVVLKVTMTRVLGVRTKARFTVVEPEECHRKDMTFFPHSSLFINQFTYIKYSFSLFYNAPGTF